jgi:hypothetical protein
LVQQHSLVRSRKLEHSKLACSKPCTCGRNPSACDQSSGASCSKVRSKELERSSLVQQRHSLVRKLEHKEQHKLAQRHKSQEQHRSLQQHSSLVRKLEHSKLACSTCGTDL